jgi:hypothetical protein
MEVSALDLVPPWRNALQCVCVYIKSTCMREKHQFSLMTEYLSLDLVKWAIIL